MEANVIVLLICHILSDYYFQSNNLAKAKESRLNKLILHLIIYSFSFIVAAIIIQILYNYSLWIAIFLSIFMHAVIDLAKFNLPNKIIQKLSAEQLYLLDQFLHVISIIIAGYLFLDKDLSILTNHLLILKTILYLLLIFKPANITFKKLFGKIKVSKDTSKNNAGAIIGSLERLLMIALIYLNQFSAIGLVLTAKSIARYNKIAEDSEFAEYYLIGTLYSVLVTILFYIVLFKI